MLKILAILFIISYLTYKVGGYLIRALYVTLGHDPSQRNFHRKSKPNADGKVSIDFVPQDKKGGKSDFKGGEYVDYEDVK